MTALRPDELVQGSAEWLAFRKKMIGASEAPIIMEQSPWTTPYQLWLEKLDMVPARQQTSAMARGLQLEDEARLHFFLQSSVEVAPKVVLHPEIKWMMASLDGISADGKIAVEIKCPQEEDHAKAARGEVPNKYFPQLQHQMEVAQLEEITYYSYHPQNGSWAIKVERDDKFIKKMLKKEEEFYDCLLTKTPPDLKENDYRERSEEAWLNQAEIVKKKRAIRKLAQAEEEEEEKKLIMLAGGSNSRGGGISICQIHKKGAIDYTKIPVLKGLDLEPYRKAPTSYWRVDVQ